MKKLVFAAMLALAPAAGWAKGVMHNIAVHVNSGDAKVMNMALNNVENVAAYYAEQGDEVTIEVVAYGPGLNMLIAGKSPVSDRIKTMSLANEKLTFAACGNTHRKMSKKAGKKYRTDGRGHNGHFRRRAPGSTARAGLCLRAPVSAL